MNAYEQLSSAIYSIPRRQLTFLPTPMQKLERLSAETGVDIYLKHDELTGICQFGGNKMRKLEYLLGEALRQGCDTVFTFGAAQSNHAMETVAASSICGLRPEVFLYTVVPPDEEDIRANLLLDRIYGAQIHLVREGGLDECLRLAAARKKQLEGAGHKCFVIPAGGADDVGSVGFIRAYLELRQQTEAAGIRPNWLFTASGTGGTMAGLCAAHSFLGDKLNVIGVAVSEKDAAYETSIAALATASLARIGLVHSVMAEEITIERDYYAPGYELPSEGATASIRRLARSEGILTDPVYSGKGFYALLNYIEQKHIPTASTVVFWHTGGATALFAEKAILGTLAER